MNVRNRRRLRAKISPPNKEMLRAEFIKKYIERNSNERRRYISRIRNGEVTPTEIGLELLENMDAVESSEIYPDDLNIEDVSKEEFESLMARIYESIQEEYEEQYNLPYSYDEGEYLGAEEEDLSIYEMSAGDFFLCMFCK